MEPNLFDDNIDIFADLNVKPKEKSKKKVEAKSVFDDDTGECGCPALLEVWPSAVHLERITLHRPSVIPVACIESALSWTLFLSRFYFLCGGTLVSLRMRCVDGLIIFMRQP